MHIFDILIPLQIFLNFKRNKKFCIRHLIIHWNGSKRKDKGVTYHMFCLMFVQPLREQHSLLRLRLNNNINKWIRKMVEINWGRNVSRVDTWLLCNWHRISSNYLLSFYLLLWFAAHQQLIKLYSLSPTLLSKSMFKWLVRQKSCTNSTAFSLQKFHSIL